MEFIQVAVLFCVLAFLRNSASGMPVNDCENEEDGKFTRFLKNPNCALNSHVTKIKTGIFLIRDQLWSELENFKGRFANNKNDLGDMDFDELSVEDATTRRLRRDDEEIETNGETETTEATNEDSSSHDYLDPLKYNLLRAPSKCTAGQKIVGGRCRQIY